MLFKENIKSVLTELSPIVAGFKLAVIVIGYFGLGSVAKWIISYWYPFTRWVWDQVAIQLSFPEFPLIVKDSLTALVFFMPLGIIAIIQMIRGEERNEEKHRISSALFGFLFLFLICKDVISSIVSSLSSSLQAFSYETTLYSSEYSTFFIAFYMVLIAVYFAIRLMAAKQSHYEAGSFFEAFLRVESRIKNNLVKKSKTIFKTNFYMTIVALPLFCVYLILVNDSVDAGAIVGAIGILIVIVISLLLAIFYAPKKLFITTGAAIAFVLAALLFESFVTFKSFMESVSSG